MTASPPAAPGMPSEEDIARAMRPAVWARCDAAGVTSESTGSGITLGDLTARATSLLDANTILSLIRPAFEAKDAEAQHWQTRATVYKRLMTDAQRGKEAAEAKLAQAVEALEPFSKIDCAVDGGHAFDPWADDRVVFGIGADRTITAGDLRRARSASAAASGEA